MLNYSKIRLTDYLINLTGSTISVYEELSGNIKTFFPQKLELPPEPRMDADKPVIHYVVEPRLLKRIAGKRELTDIVIVDSEDKGRDGRLISRLVWAKEPGTLVKVCMNASRSLLPHL